MTRFLSSFTFYRPCICSETLEVLCLVCLSNVCLDIVYILFSYSEVLSRIPFVIRRFAQLKFAKLKPPARRFCQGSYIRAERSARRATAWDLRVPQVARQSEYFECTMCSPSVDLAASRKKCREIIFSIIFTHYFREISSLVLYFVTKKCWIIDLMKLSYKYVIILRMSLFMWENDIFGVDISMAENHGFSLYRIDRFVWTSMRVLPSYSIMRTLYACAAHRSRELYVHGWLPRG